jgi:hypothetical protein
MSTSVPVRLGTSGRVLHAIITFLQLELGKIECCHGILVTAMAGIATLNGTVEVLFHEPFERRLEGSSAGVCVQQGRVDDSVIAHLAIV